MQAPFRQVIPPPGIIFDSDLGRRAESVLALAVAYGLDARNETRVTAVTVSTPSLAAAAYCDAVAKFYAAGGFSRMLPIGLALDSGPGEDVPMLQAALSRKTPEGAPVYARSIENLNDTAIVGAVLRNALTASHDGNSIMVLAGPATNYAALLNVPGAKDWIAKKCRYLVIAPAGAPDVASAKRLLEEWPSPIVAVSEEAGKGILLPASAVEEKITWTKNHPVLDAWKAAGAKDLPTTELAAVLYGVRPKETFFRLSEPGKLSVSDDGRMTLTPDPNGKHRTLALDPAEKERLLATYIELASQKPVPRQRFRPPQAEQPKPDTPKAKPDPAKPASSGQ